VLDRRFSRRRFWSTIQTQQITWINAVPAIITVLAMEPPAVRPSRRVRFVRSASAPLPPSVLRRFEEAFGIPVVETYGMTEAASMITANPLDGPRKAGSAGLPAGAEVRVVRPAGPRDVPGPAGPRDVPGPAGPRDVPCPAGPRYVPCPACTVGRVQIRGRGVITRYAAGGPAGAIDRDGWLDTGDLGHLDSDGYLFLAGRSDDVINRGGEKIYPREIEDVLLAQPGVRFAAVVAARDQVLGERPVAYVVPARPGPRQPLKDALFEETPFDEALFEEALFEDALREACEAALPRPKRPAAFHLVPELPVGPTGKVARRRLRELSATTMSLPLPAAGAADGLGRAGLDGADEQDLDRLGAAFGLHREQDRGGLVGRVDPQVGRLGRAAGGGREVQRVRDLQLGGGGGARGQRNHLDRRHGVAALGGQANLRVRARQQRHAGVAEQRARGARGIGEVDGHVHPARVALRLAQFHPQRAVRAGRGSDRGRGRGRRRRGAGGRRGRRGGARRARRGA
jgi:hypothetical protein